MVEMLRADEFNAAIEDSDVPVLVDLFATWCGPCKMMAPIVEEMSEVFDGRLRVYKVDVDESPRVAIEYGVSSIPTFLFFRDGEMVRKMVGGMDPEDFEAAIEDVLA